GSRAPMGARRGATPEPGELKWAALVVRRLERRPSGMATYGELRRSGIGIPRRYLSSDEPRDLIRFLKRFKNLRYGKLRVSNSDRVPIYLPGFERAVDAAKAAATDATAAGTDTASAGAEAAAVAAAAAAATAPAAADNARPAAPTANVSNNDANNNGGVGGVGGGSGGWELEDRVLSYKRALYDYLASHPEGVTMSQLATSQFRVPPFVRGSMGAGAWLNSDKRHWLFRKNALYARRNARP
ncbi:hypothetical protein Agub_g12924, partial [Astrephomene gubernaculifera]